MSGALKLAAGPAVAIAAIAGAAFALVSTLPKPTAGDRLAVRVLERLESTRSSGGTLQLAGEEVTVRCRTLAPNRHLIMLGNGARLVLAGTHVHVLRTALPPEPMLADLVVEAPGLPAAEADLSGSHALYARELVSQLIDGTVETGVDSIDGRPAGIVRLTTTGPFVDLLFDLRTLAPLAVRFRSSELVGEATLGDPVPLGSRRAC